jgi:demethoxyubiquinone hydroxylase (CLK1/Coq7/Cat5 family)
MGGIMDYAKLFESLARTAEQLRQMRIEEIDFAQLATELASVGAALQSLQARAVIADQLLQLFKDELCHKSRAVAKLTGGSSELVERLINADTTDLADLQRIKHDIETEFDRVFSRKLTEPTGAAAGGEKPDEFKI